MKNKMGSESISWGALVAKSVALIVTITLIGFTLFNVYKTLNFDKFAPDWRESGVAMDSYRTTANHYNDAKQLVIDAYNKQLDQIKKDGLKTQNDFDGIKFKTNAFVNSMHKDDSEWTLVNNREYAQAADQVFKAANRRINKLREYYNKKIGDIYDDLKANKNVNFSSLKEYGDGPEFAQFAQNDFNETGKKYATSIGATAQKWYTIYLALWAALAIIVCIPLILLL